MRAADHPFSAFQTSHITGPATSLVNGRRLECQRNLAVGITLVPKVVLKEQDCVAVVEFMSWFASTLLWTTSRQFPPRSKNSPNRKKFSHRKIFCLPQVKARGFAPAPGQLAALGPRSGPDWTGVLRARCQEAVPLSPGGRTSHLSSNAT